MGRRTKIISVTKESKALKKLRTMKGLSVRKVADLLGVSHTLVSHLELGRANISKEYIGKFLKALHFSPEDWRIVLGGGKKSDFLAKDKMAEDCFSKLQELPEDKLRLLQSILRGM